MVMRRAGAVAAAAILTICVAGTAGAQTGRMVVTGISDDDMLKLRAGPGTGYRVIVGLPEGTVLIARGCDRVGGTPWCTVRLAEARGLKGYVSGHYLRAD